MGEHTGSEAFADARVVVLDDSRNFQNLLRTLLHQYGLRRLDVFVEPRAALAHVCEHATDLVFVDLVMPGMNGIDWVRSVRRDRRLANQRMSIAMITARADRRIVEAALAAGVDDFLVKPLAPAVLWRHVTRVLTRPHPYVRTADGYFGPNVRGRLDRKATIEPPVRAVAATDLERQRRPRRLIPGLDVELRPSRDYHGDQAFLD